MAVFRFLINVDKCLDTSHYNCFFYKLKSRGETGQGLFHLSEAQLLDGDPLSLRGAVSDVRMYLDKYPYEVEDYRIILVMRCPQEDILRQNVWEGSLLYRLLRLRYEFLKSRIMLSTAVEAKRDNALNFVMLYDSYFAADMPVLEPYFFSGRLMADVQLLLKKYGVTEETADISNLVDGLEQTRLQADAEGGSFSADAYAAPHEADLLLRFLNAYKKETEDLIGQDTLASLLSSFTKELLFNYRVYERYINRGDRREETMSFLRLVDFITHDTVPSVTSAGHAAASTLADRCDAAWDEVWSDQSAQLRYATMLAGYNGRLEGVYRSLEKPTFPTDVNQDLPAMEVPSETAVTSKNNSFDEDSPEQRRREGVLEKLEKYATKKLFGKSFRSDWNSTYEEIVSVLNDLKGSLRIYAQDLSAQYAQILEERKQESLAQKNINYAIPPKRKEELDIVKEERDVLLQRLKEPHMNPSMSFQDVLNSEKKLEQSSKNISFYLDCLRETTFANFLLLLILCAGMFVVHYTILQPYALTGVDTLIYYLCYIAAAVFLMTTAFMVPYNYYCRRVQNSIQQLQGELRVYIRSYYERAKYFSEYINHINRLDYLTRRYELISLALKRGHNITSGQLWHRDQIDKHLNMLSYFSGLIESAPGEAIAPDLTVVTNAMRELVSNGQVREVADCRIYWPQG